MNRDEFTPIVVTDPQSPVLTRFQATGARVMTVAMPRLNGSPVAAARLIHSGAALARVAREARADVMHTFTTRTHLMGAVGSLLCGVPLVWRIGDDTLPAWAMRLFSGAPRSIVGVSDWLTSQYPAVPFDGLVPDGTGTPLAITREEARAELSLPPDALIVAHVGRLVRWKGQDVFLKALGDVARTVPGVHGLVVGNWHAEDDEPGPFGGGEPYARGLRELADRVGLNDPSKQGVTFSGFIRHPGLAYAAADVVVHSSTRPEPFGRTVIEAMMAGRPVIAARAGGPSEIIEDGVSGMLTEPCDVAALASALTAMLTSAPLRERIALGGQQRAERNYSLEIMTRRMENTYRRAIGAGKA